MRIVFSLAFAFSTFLAGSAAFAADASRGSAEEAVALVQKIIAAIKKDGREKTFADINDIQGGKFKDRDLYITVNTLQGLNLAHGANARMQGKDLIDLKDPDGKYFVRERLELAKTKGKGWQDYKFVNPVSKKMEQKSMYFEKYEDLVINCGIYK